MVDPWLVRPWGSPARTPLGWAQTSARKPGAYGTNGPLTRTRDGSFITASSFRWTIREKLPTKPDEHYADSEPVKTARGQPRTSPRALTPHNPARRMISAPVARGEGLRCARASGIGPQDRPPLHGSDHRVGPWPWIKRSRPGRRLHGQGVRAGPARRPDGHR